MFTGIVQGTAKVVSIDDKPNFRTHVVELPAHMLEGLETGASVANNGCCLTGDRNQHGAHQLRSDERDAADYQSWRYSGRR